MPLVCVVAFLYLSLPAVTCISVFLPVTNLVLHDHVVTVRTALAWLSYQLLGGGLSVNIDIKDVLLLILETWSLIVCCIHLVRSHELWMARLVERCSSKLWSKVPLQLLWVHSVLPHVEALREHLLRCRHRQQLVVLLLLHQCLLQELLLLRHVLRHLLPVSTLTCRLKVLHSSRSHLLLLHLLKRLHLRQLLHVVIHLLLLLELHHGLELVGVSRSAELLLHAGHRRRSRAESLSILEVGSARSTTHGSSVDVERRSLGSQEWGTGLSGHLVSRASWLLGATSGTRIVAVWLHVLLIYRFSNIANS